MEKSNGIGLVLLVAFMGILAMPLLSAPMASQSEDHQSNIVFFESGDDHTSQWLIHCMPDSEEFNAHITTRDSFLLFTNSINVQSTINRVRFSQISKQKDTNVPKERIYLINSCLTI
jgi:hypothetical protein